jgi:hypothetical protein
MTEVDDFLAHFGVAGMKWGKRSGGSPSDAKKSPAPRAAGYTNRMQKNDFRKVGKQKGIEKVHQKVANGTPLSKAREQVTNDRKKRKTIAVQLSIAAIGLAYAAPVLKEFGGMALDQAVVRKKAANGEKYARNIMADKRGLTNYSTIRMHQNPTTGNWV